MGRYTGGPKVPRYRRRERVPLDVERARELLACHLCGARPPELHAGAPECPGADPKVYAAVLAASVAEILTIGKT